MRFGEFVRVSRVVSAAYGSGLSLSLYFIEFGEICLRDFLWIFGWDWSRIRVRIGIWGLIRFYLGLPRMGVSNGFGVSVGIFVVVSGVELLPSSGEM